MEKIPSNVELLVMLAPCNVRERVLDITITLFPTPADAAMHDGFLVRLALRSSPGDAIMLFTYKNYYFLKFSSKSSMVHLGNNNNNKAASQKEVVI